MIDRDAHYPHPLDFPRMAGGFSNKVLGRPLRPYQKQIAANVLESVLRGYGCTFTVVMARQMGKNELSAHLEAMLLCRHAKPGATLVKAAPTFRPQVTTSLQRLESVLKAAQALGTLTRRGPDGKDEVLKPKKEHGYQLVVDDARISFLSADPAASVVGATASLLLELDEAQDVDPEKFTRDFRPMASSRNATTILYGTAWTQDTLLEQQKATNLQLQQEDGFQRHFEFDWRAGAAVNRNYEKFVRAEIERLSISHPLIRTQYLLLPLAEAGAFFTAEQRALLRGDHPRQNLPADKLPQGTYYAAGIDVAGPAEAPQDADHLLRSRQPRKDSTVVLIAEVTPVPSGHPITRIVEAYWWTGRPLHEQCDRLATILRDSWKCARVCVDASGLGLDLATRLQKAMPDAVEPFSFNVSSKSELAYGLLAHAASGRLQMWAEDPFDPSARGAADPNARSANPGAASRRSHAAPRLRTQPALRPGQLGPASQGYAALSPEANEFWREVDRARPIHRSTSSNSFSSPKLSFYVPEHYGHDDFLTALALLSRAASTPTTHTPYVPPLTFVSPPPPPRPLSF